MKGEDFNVNRDLSEEVQLNEANRHALFTDKFRQEIDKQKALRLNAITDARHKTGIFHHLASPAFLPQLEQRLREDPIIQGVRHPLVSS